MTDLQREHLVAWLRQVLASIVTANTRAADGSWRLSSYHRVGCAHDQIAGLSDCRCGRPARAIAAVEADGKMLDLFVEILAGRYIDDGELVLAEVLLPILASRYQHRPGWREEWAT